MEQRLTAIFAMDMVGYSRLMEADEMGTIIRHKKHREELVDPAILGFGGRIMKEMGDGILVEFASVAGAVQCAIEIQRAMPAREAALQPEQRIAYRIGINLGDIVDDGHEVYGDGINVAARLEQMAEPGGICISGTAHDVFRSTSDVAFRSMGPVTVKNINRPILAFSVELNPSMGGAGEKYHGRPHFEGRGARWIVAAVGTMCAIAVVSLLLTSQGYIPEWLSRGASSRADVPVSLALFPFRDLSEASGGSYLSAGISEDLATEISERADLLLITPSMPPTEATEPADILFNAERLGADYVLSGTVQQNGAGPRVNVILGSVASGETLLEKSYDREATTLASVGKDISVDIVSAMPDVQPRAEQDHSREYHYPDPTAYDLLLQGNVEFARFSPASLEAAEAFYRRAAEVDPDYARPKANIAFIHALQVALGLSDQPEELARKAEALANAALQIDPSVHQAYLARGLLARSRRQYQTSIAEFNKAVEIAPNSADAYAMIAVTEVFAGDPEGGLASIEKAMKRNPDQPYNYLWAKGLALFHLERFDAAADFFEAALRRNPEFLPARLLYVSTLSHLGRTDDAEWEFEEVLVRQPEFSVLREQAQAPYANINDTLRYIRGLKAAAER